MREWNIALHEKLALTLAADVRLGGVDYVDDQIWSISAETGEPPALAAGTTFGLRARSFRIFPRFTEGDQTCTSIESYARRPVVRRLYPNYLLVDFSPFEGIDVQAEYWVPDSHTLAGRMQITNTGSAFRVVTFELCVQLTPIEGERMAGAEMSATTVLRGRTANLAPLVFLTGGPRIGSGPYPALTQDLELSIGQSRTLTWTHCAMDDHEASFTHGREIAASSWSAQIARIEMINAGGIEIYTGDQDWDLVLALSQRRALQLFVGPTAELTEPSFVLTRQPDQGYSLRGDGGDYDHLWNGQLPLESYFLSGLVVAAAPELAKGIVRNFIASQDEAGTIDLKPGLGGQRSQVMATPIIAGLAWKIFSVSEDKAFLEEIFQPLISFVQAWFSNMHDRDGDGVPEWDNTMQSGFEDHPLFSPYHEWTNKIDITTVESPALCAMLYHECQAVIQIAQTLGYPEAINAMTSLRDHLYTALEIGWDESGSYRYWDRDTHQTNQSEFLGSLTGSGMIELQREFPEPIRLHFRIRGHSGTRTSPDIFIHGRSATDKNRIERIPPDHFRWSLEQAVHTGEMVYSAINKIEVKGVNPDATISVHVVGLRALDQTLFLPLWGGPDLTPHSDKIVSHSLCAPDAFWSAYGIRACSLETEDVHIKACNNIHIIWNHLIGEGLLQYGYREQAAELVMNLMQAIIQTYKARGDFRRYYDAERGLGNGEHGAVNGLAPIELFLEALGVRLIGPWKVVLNGKNNFPWPVTVKYRGLTVLRGKEKTSVIFPDGQTASIDDEDQQIVTLESTADARLAEY